jgi:hypothetical protein
MINNQSNNAFDVLKNYSNTRAFLNITQDTQSQNKFQIDFKSRERLFNNKKMIKNEQNDDEL